MERWQDTGRANVPFSDQKIVLYNAINIVQGYSEIRIHSPLEVIEHEDKDV